MEKWIEMAARRLAYYLHHNPKGELPQTGDILYRCRHCGSPLHSDTFQDLVATVIREELDNVGQIPQF